MLRIVIAALAALFIANTVLAEEGNPDAVEDAAFYTPDWTENPASLDWDPENSTIDPGLSYRMLDQFGNDYPTMSMDINLRFAGHHMVMVVGCGGYLQCGVLVNLKTGRPMMQLPTAGVGGYEFYSDCDFLSVRPPNKDHPDQESDYVLYRLTPYGLDKIEGQYADCTTYTGSLD